MIMVPKMLMVSMLSKACLVPKAGMRPKMFLVAMVSMASAVPIVLEVLVVPQVPMVPNMPWCLRLLLVSLVHIIFLELMVQLRPLYCNPACIPSLLNVFLIRAPL